MKAPPADNTGLAPLTGAPDAMVRLPEVTRVAPALAVTPDVPATVPTVSAEPSVTARLATLAASVPTLLPDAFSTKLPPAPESSRFDAVMVPAACVAVPFSEKTRGPPLDEIDT